MQAVVQAIHDSPLRVGIITTGGGASALSHLTSIPGCSRTLVHADVPYSYAASTRMLDSFPVDRVGCDVGHEFAQFALAKAQTLLEAEGLLKRDHASDAASGRPVFEPSDAVEPLGIGCTAAVDSANDSVESGACIATWSRHGVTTYGVCFAAGSSRTEQEALVGAVMVYAMAMSDSKAAKVAEANRAALGIPDVTIVEDPALLRCTGSISESRVACKRYLPADDPFTLLIRGDVSRVVFNTHGIPRHCVAPHTVEPQSCDRATYLLVPGSFNPLHWGHTELARVAKDVVTRWQDAQMRRQGKTGRKNVVVTYEISTTIVGKRDLRESDLAARVEQFTSGGLRVAVTTAKLFVDKARMFPNHGLVVGIDTAERVLDPKYYDNCVEGVKAALTKIREHGCFFVVGGRLKQAEDGTTNQTESAAGVPSEFNRTDSFSDVPEGAVWVDASRLQIPDGFKDMFVAIAKEDFRVDISSTELRARRADVKEMKLYVDVERIYNELREMGVPAGQPLTVEQLLPFDQYHYFGTDTVDEGVRKTNIHGGGARVLDVGSGLGGPARYLAKKYGCRVTAVELQSDVSRVAADLTERCGLKGQIDHRAADFMAPDHYHQEAFAKDVAQYDAVVSWLVFVHISDRATLLKRCFDALKPGGRLFVEDFHMLAPFTGEELHMLNHDVHCSYLPTITEFERQLATAGFVDIAVEDYSAQARQFAQERVDGYRAAMARHERVHGKETAQGMLHFYHVISTLFNGGKFGLCRVLARKPESSPVLAGRAGSA